MVSLPNQDYHRILLIKPSAVGDVIHALPVLVKLRRRFPQARIDWLITPANGELVRAHPALSNAVLFDRRKMRGFFLRPTALATFYKMMRQIRAVRYDLVIDLQGLSRSAWIGLLSGARTRIGFARAREGAAWLYTRHIPVPTLEVHAAERNLWLGPLLGLDDEPPDFSLFLPADAVAGAEQLLERHRLRDRAYAVLAPGTTWETKHWQLDGFCQVARDLLADGMGVVLVGSPAEQPRCQAIAQAVAPTPSSGIGQQPGAAVPPAAPLLTDLSGQTTLGELAEIIRRAALCLTNDSGTMHLAAALQRPLVSVFGPTNPVRTGPYGRPQSVVRVGLPCSPCYLRKLAQCPYDHACMRQVTAPMVLAQIRRNLGSP